MEFPNDELDFRLCWTSKASEVVTWGSARAQAEKKAGEAYVRKQDQVAEAMRNLAGLFDGFYKTCSAELDKYIAEDQRREAEFRQVMKAPRPKLEMKRG